LNAPIPPSAPAPLAAEDPRAALRGTETILLVDDEPSVRRTGGRILERFGYTVLLAEDGEDALRVLKTAPDRVALVVTDMVMPRMDARDLIVHLRRLYPTLPVLLSTGYDMGRLGGGELQLFDRFVPKPYTPEEILSAIRQTLDVRRSA
jgi:CheY-like chemotaxis protein